MRVDPPASEPTAAQQTDRDLLAEVEHDVGNLVHRMFYWTEVIETRIGGDAEGAEAATELRVSLTELHRLLGRAVDLLSPLQMRVFSVLLGDVVDRIARRLGTRAQHAAGSPALASLLGCEIKLDPMHLDRAVDMLGEALGCATDGDGEAAAVQVEILTFEEPGSSGVEVRISAEACDPASARHVSVSAIARCLAEKIFHELGWHSGPWRQPPVSGWLLRIPVPHRRLKSIDS